MPDVRPLRYCDVCGELDDHPRHVVSVPAGTPGAVPSQEFLDSLPPGPVSAVAQLIAPTTVIRHLNCCADAGCQVCAITEEATAGARGSELVAILTAPDALAGVDVTDVPLNVEAL